ncbi:MAG: asparagine synthase (glutamine-hydrolyzing) [Candidatus Magasanikbacteria bacterium]|jgi:asparagine synthase (glutamine-hydrolysing)|nr:asparagine synthase (glutamine-hydrolyzing) [Candidatus Magasanikbacteria bacterium]
MCGIIGGISPQLTKEILEPMVHALRHRGPDGADFFVDTHSHVAFGHTRLSIIDVSSRGSQPMTILHNNKTYTITFNGEVYNYRELKKQLQNLGHIFLNDTDTEVVLHAYAEWGKESFQKCIGMFAYAIWDHEKKEMILVRDRFGVKPLYYYHANKLFLFASEIKAILASGMYAKELDREALQLYLQLGYTPGQFSIYRHILKLEPGTYLTVSEDGALNIQPYWRPNISIKQTSNTSIESLHTLLKRSFQYRTVADVDIGVFLSGGIDSSLVTAVLARDQKQKLQTFTIGFSEREYDEAPYAKKIANALQTDHHELYVTDSDVYGVIKQLPNFFDEPFADPSAIPTYLLAKYTRQYVKVALSGDGGDELFAGYTKYQAIDALLHSRINRWGVRLLTLFPISFVANVYRQCIKRTSISAYSNIERKIYKLKRISGHRTLKDMFLASTTFFHTKEINQLLLDPSDHNVLSDIFVVSEKNSIQQMQLWDIQQYLPNDILVKSDRMSMAHGVEAREPFLDESILQFVSQIPYPKIKKQVGTKQLLKNILGDYVSPSLFERKKSGFVPPLYHWLRSSWGDELREKYLSDTFIEKQNIFSLSFIQQLRNEVTSKNVEQLWIILVFQMWYEKWMIEDAS